MNQIKLRAWDRHTNRMLDHDYLQNFKLKSICEVYGNGYLMQSSGLEDASDDKKEVYTSDIIEWYADNSRTIKRRGVVRLIDGSFVVVFADNLRLYLTKVIEWGGIVVGNEFENPELLGVNDEKNN